MRNLDTSLTRKEEAFSECNDEKRTLQERISNLEKDVNQKQEDITSLQDINVSFIDHVITYSL